MEGAAFLIVYLAMVAIIGIPIMIVEFVIGREGRKDAIGSFKKLAPGKPWFASGVLGVLAAFFILAFYGVVAGWTLEYIVKAATNSFAGQSSEQITTMFTSFIADLVRPIMWQVVFMGIMITYGSYIDDNENLGKMAVKISIADTIIALLAGIAIFPAVFAFGIEPTSGAGLVFMALPNVFPQMPGGYLFGILFFTLLALAALTSTISLLEAVVAYVVDTFHLARRKATILTALAVTLVGMIASLSNGVLSHIQIGGDNIFDFLDNTTANYFLTFAALISVVFLGWFLDKEIVKKQLTNNGTIEAGYMDIFFFLAKFIAPVAIILVFLFQIGII